jgi:hypothetical protein
MVDDTVAEHPLSSVTVNVYAPGERFVVDGEVVYGAVPPDIDNITDPSFKPLQLTLFCVTIETFKFEEG